MMSELNKTKVTVDELLQAVRLELAKIQGYAPEKKLVIHDTNPIIADDISYVESIINNAESRANTRTKWPDKYNRFPFNFSKSLQKLLLKLLQMIFVDQREVNFSFIQAFRKSMLVSQELVEEIIELKTQIKTFEDKIIELCDRYNKDRSESLKVFEQHLLKIVDTIKELSDEHQDRDNTTTHQLKILTQQTNELRQLYFNDYGYLKNDLSQQKRLMALFLEEAHQRLPDKFTQEQLQNFNNEESHLLDSFYVNFEAQFRGSWEEIANRLKVYLPWLEEAKISMQKLPILDIGCGRGEWLELLKHSGFVARGLDINRVMVEQCQIKGFDVIEGDALTYLQSLSAASLGAVTGFHIIEHLPFNSLIKLLYETNRVLVPGGIAIFETPNPDNVLVGSSSFYLDPTHYKPLPSPTTKFVVEFCGFSNVQILKLNRPDISISTDNSELARHFNEYFYGYRDYAVIGFKA